MRPSKCHTSLFMKAVGRTIRHEGGARYTKIVGDAGGETKYGISKRAHPKVNIKALTKDEAIQIYWVKYWLPVYEQMWSDVVACKVFDLHVVMGKYQAHKCIQLALRACGHRVVSDGGIGPKTLKAVKIALDQPLNAPVYLGDSTALLAGIRSEAYGRFREIAAANPVQKKFLRGWMNRAYL